MGRIDSLLEAGATNCTGRQMGKIHDGILVESRDLSEGFRASDCMNLVLVSRVANDRTRCFRRDGSPDLWMVERTCWSARVKQGGCDHAEDKAIR